MFSRFGATVSIFRVTDLVQMDAEVVRSKRQERVMAGSVSDRPVGHLHEGRNRRQRCSEPTRGRGGGYNYQGRPFY